MFDDGIITYDKLDEFARRLREPIVHPRPIVNADGFYVVGTGQPYREEYERGTVPCFECGLRNVDFAGTPMELALHIRDAHPELSVSIYAVKFAGRTPEPIILPEYRYAGQP